MRPALLVRSGTGIPNWISPLECLKLLSEPPFECCENKSYNHQRHVDDLSVSKVLRKMIENENSITFFK